jgi:hypothetical protein
MRADAPVEEKNCDKNNIAGCFQKKNMRRLRNVRLLRIFSSEAFPRADYGWYEKKENYGVYSVIAPLAARDYFEQIKRDPFNPNKVTGRYDLEIEEVVKDLNLTVVEAAWFLADPVNGQVQVMRDAYQGFSYRDPESRDMKEPRTGIRDVVFPASGSMDLSNPDAIAEHVLESGAFTGTMAKELPLDYVISGSTPGGMGTHNSYLEGICRMELKRRHRVGEADSRVREMLEDSSLRSETEPFGDEDNGDEDNGTTDFQCQGTTGQGTRCKNDAIDGSRYCRIHAEQAVNV